MPLIYTIKNSLNTAVAEYNGSEVGNVFQGVNQEKHIATLFFAAKIAQTDKDIAALIFVPIRYYSALKLDEKKCLKARLFMSAHAIYKMGQWEIG